MRLGGRGGEAWVVQPYIWSVERAEGRARRLGWSGCKAACIQGIYTRTLAHPVYVLVLDEMFYRHQKGRGADWMYIIS